MINIAVLGASGMVGQTILSILEERQVAINNIYFFSSKRSAGQTLNFKGKEHTMIELSHDAILNLDIDYALMSAGGDISLEYAPLLVDKGVCVIDNASVWRMDPDVPLVIPEVNESMLKGSLLIANPNCSTIQSVLVLKPLEDLLGIKRVVYSTYQAVSGSGVAGISDLKNKETKNYPYPIHKNVIPHIDSFLDNGYSKEEMKMIEETRKILNRPNLKVTATTVRVPLVNTHAVSINIEFDKDFTIESIRQALSNYPGIVVADDLEHLIYPLAQDADGKDAVYVGRIRRDESLDYGINLWCVADNIRKGAALNTVQILESKMKEDSL